MMKLGPEKTGAFKGGFSFGAAKAKAKAGPGAGFSFGAAKPKAAAAASGGVPALFQQSMDEEEDDPTKKRGKAPPSWATKTEQSKKAERLAAELVAEDPTVFQYDEVIDDVREEQGLEAMNQQVRTDVLTQKKRVGLCVPEGAEKVATGSSRQAKYIEKVMLATDRRKVEQQIVEDKLLRKEKDARKDCEVFVTEAFKEELKRRKKFEDDMEMQDVKDRLGSAENQQNGLGFAGMYRNLLNSGLASGRGGEKHKEIVPAKMDLEEVEEVDPFKTEADVKREQEEKVKAEEEASSGHGVVDVKTEEAAAPEKTAEEKAAEKAAEEAADKEQREGKAMSAKERYLLRKRAVASEA